jgi:hypothetical protein
MPLRNLDLAPSDDPIPADVARFIREADRRIDVFQDACRVPGFVPSDYSTAYRVLRSVAESGLTRGRQFCEWGSGFGVIACLAAMLDFDSCGVEVENILVEEARKLADDFELPVEFAAGSYVPRGAEDRIHRGGSYSWFSTEGDYAYEDLGLDPRDMDVVFAYPWPDEEPVTIDLFQRYCGSGALLITFHGGDDFRIRRNRKSGKRGRR